MHTQSILGEQSPWSDEAWSNKKIMPGYVWRSSVAGWNRRLTITAESFTLMAHWQAHVQRTRLPQLRRKIDKPAMEEGSQICALFLSLKHDLMEQYPVADEEFLTVVQNPFILSSDQNLLLYLQNLIHSKPENVPLTDVPLYQDCIDKHITKSDVNVTGTAATEKMKQDIEDTEFQLLKKKFATDIDM
eukprot:7190397-Karenia_brevis.AAC.1